MQNPATASSKFAEILACLSQTQFIIRATSNLVGVVVILTVIFPKANWTNLVTASLAKCPATTAWATI